MQTDLFIECDAASEGAALPAHEEWSSVREFPAYEVSTLGRFRDVKRGRTLAGTKNHNGYIHIGLMRGGKQEWSLAHRLVADAFLLKPKTDLFLLVNHKNRNRHNNAVANLEWCTCAANAKHWRKHKRETHALKESP